MSRSAPQLEIAWAAPPPAAQEWNPRYLAYCRVHGRTPDEQLVHDRARRPGASMLAYMQWIDTQRRAVQVALTAIDGQRRHWTDGNRPDVTEAIEARLVELGPCPGCKACEPPVEDAS